MALDPVVWSVSLALELEIRTEDRGGEGRRVISLQLAGQTLLKTGPAHDHVFFFFFPAMQTRKENFICNNIR